MASIVRWTLAANDPVDNVSIAELTWASVVVCCWPKMLVRIDAVVGFTSFCGFERAGAKVDSNV